MMKLLAPCFACSVVTISHADRPARARSWDAISRLAVERGIPTGHWPSSLLETDGEEHASNGNTKDKGNRETSQEAAKPKQLATEKEQAPSGNGRGQDGDTQQRQRPRQRPRQGRSQWQRKRSRRPAATGIKPKRHAQKRWSVPQVYQHEDGYIESSQERDEDAFGCGFTEECTTQARIILVILALSLALAFISSIRNMMILGRLAALRISNAWLCCLQLVVMILPLVVPSLRKIMPPKVLENYMAVAFWNAFSNADYCGTYVMYAFHMFWGAFLSVIAMSIWDYSIPGSNPCAYDPKCQETHPDYDPRLFFDEVTGVRMSILYASCWIYFMLVSRLNINTKRLFLYCMSDFMMRFINPKGDYTDFAPFLLNYDFTPNFVGCGSWTLLTVFIAFFIRVPLQYALPLETLTRGQISYSCHRHLKDGLKMLVQDNVEILSLLLNRHLMLDRKKVHELIMHSEARIKELKILAQDAWWEVLFKGDELCHLNLCLDMFTDVRKTNKYLILIAEHLEDTSVAVGNHEGQTVQDAMTKYSTGLVDAYRTTLYLIIDTELDHDSRSHDVKKGMHLAAKLQTAMMVELRNLHVKKKISIETVRQTLGFVQAAVMWTSILKETVDKIGTTSLEPVALSPHIANFFRSTLLDVENHFTAAFTTIVWLFCFWTAAFYLQYKAALVTTMSLMIFESTDYILDVLMRLLKRTSGIALGVVSANVPAYLLCNSLARFVVYPEDFYSYCIILLAIWGLLMYGTIACESLTYIFQTWAAFGTYELLRPLMQDDTTESNSGTKSDTQKAMDIKQRHFDSMIAAMTGMTFYGGGVVLMVFAKSMFRDLVQKFAPDEGEDPLSNAVENVLNSLHKLIVCIKSGEDKGHSDVEDYVRQSMSRLEQVVEKQEQVATLLSSHTHCKVTTDVIIEQCDMVCSISECLDFIQDQGAIDRTPIMGPLLPESKWLADSKFQNNKLEVDKTWAREQIPSAERQEQWHQELQDASDPQKLNDLADKWSFEVAAQLIHLSLERLRSFPEDLAWRQEAIEAKAQTKASYVFSDIIDLLNKNNMEVH